MYLLKFHPSLNPERWAQFPFDRQILMVANEVNRLKNGVAAGQPVAVLRETMERAFELIDLTVECVRGLHGTLRELLRWRELFAALYEHDEMAKKDQALSQIEALFKVLMLMSSGSAKAL